MTQFGGAYRNRRVLVTGHTGFKGSWLALWLDALGAKVTGLAIAPSTTPSHWDLLGLKLGDRRIDIRNASAVADAVRETAPEIIFHLAAQSLVRQSYRDPLETWSTNVLGTANVLEASRVHPGVRSVIVVTTDKCYENREWDWSYREADRLGGRDPYSASKASAELVTASYRQAFFNRSQSPLLASARAGNVIGGGDWCEERLIPDAVRAMTRGVVLQVRFPAATRPWQHVLEPLSGYLLLGQKLLEGRAEFAEAWNFGPSAEGNHTVGELLQRLKSNWHALQWEVARGEQPYEARQLQLDSAKARHRMKWVPVWSLDEALEATAQWYRTYLEQGEVLSLAQLQAYAAAAARSGLEWSKQ